MLAPASFDRRTLHGLSIGFIGVVIFGVTMPMTRLAVSELGPVFVTAGRALVAAACAGIVLAVMRSPLPARETWPRFALFAVMVVLAFPLCMALALQHAPAAHGGVILALQPLLTALASIFVAGERPSRAFWLCSAVGSATVMVYALLASAASGAMPSELHWADALLAVASVCGATGYATGGQLSRSMPGWQVISWAVVLAAPVMALILAAGLMHPAVASASAHDLAPIHHTVSIAAWGAFAYVGMFSMYLGFFAWNTGLAMGGIAKVGQLQLLQPFVTLVSSAALLGETLGWREILFSGLVVVVVAVGTRLGVKRPDR